MLTPPQECKALMQDWAAGADGSGRKWEGPAWSDTRASQLQGRVEEVGSGACCVFCAM